MRSIYFLKHKKQSIYFFTACLLFCGVIWSNSNYIPIKNTNKSVLYPPQYMKLFSFGYADYYADILWLRLVQDIDFCEKGKRKCSENWAYQMLHTITDLSPQFRTAYASGSLALSVLVDDIKGASKIFKKAIKAFPNDWQILYIAAYHFLLEEKNNALAASLLYRAAQNGAPTWLYSLASKLYKKENTLLLGILSLEAYLKTLKAKKNIIKVKKRLQALKKQYRILKALKK